MMECGEANSADLAVSMAFVVNEYYSFKRVLFIVSISDYISQDNGTARAPMLSRIRGNRGQM